MSSKHTDISNVYLFISDVFQQYLPDTLLQLRHAALIIYLFSPATVSLNLFTTVIVNVQTRTRIRQAKRSVIVNVQTGTRIRHAKPLNRMITRGRLGTVLKFRWARAKVFYRAKVSFRVKALSRVTVFSRAKVFLGQRYYLPLKICS